MGIKEIVIVLAVKNGSNIVYCIAAMVTGKQCKNLQCSAIVAGKSYYYD